MTVTRFRERVIFKKLLTDADAEFIEKAMIPWKNDARTKKNR